MAMDTIYLQVMNSNTALMARQVGQNVFLNGKMCAQLLFLVNTFRGGGGGELIGDFAGP